MAKSRKKIPVKIDWIVDETGKGGIEVIMNLEDFESSGTSIRESIRDFKKKYTDAINQAKTVEKSAKTKLKKISSKQRWKAGKILADFNKKIENEFEIKNYKEAYSRDFSLPIRSIRAYVDFATIFNEEEVVDEIPYSTYAELSSVANELKRRNILEIEKQRLLRWAKEGNLPNRDEYREHLRKISKHKG
ncbi:hypothetical protein [Candidatus Nitrosarchaeum limnium]|uniref:Uncharacterized protein n=1 Tax=Candidatus Nitrosarchaeum limnium BG20 TaxID=859192 RepID=S2EV69_9ARCH|nr:hypothetical protein [Candidatus Nitrosarchaeum limnium]EPA06179.1 hypothetical protein BG20_I0812 [Candidatus Nitrosarchaeum limnium BG20]